MGFIKDNTNTFQVYLTDLGKQKFFEEGLGDSIEYFSICDNGTNYNLFSPNPNLIAGYDPGYSGYTIGNVVKLDNEYYRLKSEPPMDSPTGVTGQTYWDKLVVFDPTSIQPQPIGVINHITNRKTSLGDGIEVYIKDVFTQVPLRGDIADNIDYNKALLGTGHDTQKEYIMYEPDLYSNNTLNVITYIVR